MKVIALLEGGILSRMGKVRRYCTEERTDGRTDGWYGLYVQYSDGEW